MMKIRSYAFGVLLSAGVALLAGGAVKAADLGGYKDNSLPAFSGPVPSWAGFYIGGNIGGAFNVHDTDTKLTGYGCQHCLEGIHAKNEDDDSTFIGGVHAGYNFQRGNIVYGIEGDVDFGDNIDYLASVRARLGYASGSWLLYATGGVAFIGTESKVKVTDGYNSISFSDDRNDTGFVVGGGIEKKIRPNLSIGIEGLYYGFGDDKSHNGFDIYEGEKFCAEEHVDSKDDLNFWTVRGRLTYHLQADYEPLK